MRAQFARVQNFFLSFYVVEPIEIERLGTSPLAIRAVIPAFAPGRGITGIPTSTQAWHKFKSWVANRRRAGVAHLRDAFFPSCSHSMT